jgi:hypothetical protein
MLALRASDVEHLAALRTFYQPLQISSLEVVMYMYVYAVCVSTLCSCFQDQSAGEAAAEALEQDQ